MKNKKTIHVLAKYFYPVTGGTILNLMNTYSSFARDDWEIVVHTTKSTLTQKDFLPERGEYRDMEIYRYNHMRYNLIPFVQQIKYGERKIICLHGCDIFPHYYTYAYFLLLEIIRKKRNLLIFSPHGLFNLALARNASSKVKIKKIIDYTIGVFLINRTVDGIRAVSNWEKELLISAGIRPSLITVITNGLEKEALTDSSKLASEQIKMKINELGRYIIQVGRIDRNKNYETPIKAIRFLPDDVKFAIVGGDHSTIYKRELIDLIKQRGLKDRVIFLGIIKGADKYLLMKKAEMMVHMSRVEGFCNAVHEGMSQGLVCIVSRNTAVEDLIADGVNGYSLDPDDYVGLAEKINFVLKNKHSPKILKMQNRNKDFATGHSWENVAKKVEQFYLTKFKYEK